MIAVREYPTCPCGCGVLGFLTKREPQHARGCRCRVHQGRRNRAKGQRSQSKGYRQLGGSAHRAPTNEEWAEALNVPIRWENKSGKQVPASFRTFVGDEWWRKALKQAADSIPVGMVAKPAVRLDLGRDGAFLVVKL